MCLVSLLTSKPKHQRSAALTWPLSSGELKVSALLPLPYSM
jgi:hypothetical protein